AVALLDAKLLGATDLGRPLRARSKDGEHGDLVDHRRDKVAPDGNTPERAAALHDEVVTRVALDVACTDLLNPPAHPLHRAQESVAERGAQDVLHANAPASGEEGAGDEE